MIYVNARFRTQRITGVQRYAQEVCRRIQPYINELRPPAFFSGVKGHIWEQLSLPAQVGTELLWNPCATGPIFHKNSITTVHDMSFFDNPQWFTRSFALWYQFLVPKIIHSSSLIITISEFTKSRIIHWTGVEPQKIVVTHLAPICPKPTGADLSREDHLTSLNLPSMRYLFAASSLEPRKNLRKLLEAWKAALPFLPSNIQLIVSGAQGSKSVFASEYYQTLPPRVQLLGYIDDTTLFQLYRNAEAFIFPSLYEGFGLPPLEAMSQGCPIIASNAASIPEVLGDSGYMFSPNSTGEIAKSIITVLTDEQLRASLSEKSINRSSLFSWENTSSRTLSVLQDHCQRQKLHN